jgi:hypothetical protein
MHEILLELFHVSLSRRDATGEEFVDDRRKDLLL